MAESEIQFVSLPLYTVEHVCYRVVGISSSAVISIHASLPLLDADAEAKRPETSTTILKHVVDHGKASTGKDPPVGTSPPMALPLNLIGFMWLESDLSSRTREVGEVWNFQNCYNKFSLSSCISFTCVSIFCRFTLR